MLPRQPAVLQVPVLRCSTLLVHRGAHQVATSISGLLYLGWPTLLSFSDWGNVKRMNMLDSSGSAKSIYLALLRSRMVSVSAICGIT